MPFGLVGRLGPRMRQVVAVGDCPTGMRILGVDVGRSIVSNGDFVA